MIGDITERLFEGHSTEYSGSKRPESVSLLLKRQMLVIEGVVTSSNPNCTREHFGSAIQAAWGDKWLPLKGQKDVLNVAEYEGQAWLEDFHECMDNQGKLVEVAYPNVWFKVAQAAKGGAVHHEMFYGQIWSDSRRTQAVELPRHIEFRLQLVTACQVDNDV